MKYEVGDMVEFTLTAYSSPKVYHGVVLKRWKTKVKYDSGQIVVLYTIHCLEKQMRPFTVAETLIIGKL